MGTLLSFLELELGAATDDDLAVLEVLIKDVCQAKHARLDAINQGHHVEVEAGLQRRQLVELVQ